MWDFLAKTRTAQPRIIIIFGNVPLMLACNFALAIAEPLLPLLSVRDATCRVVTNNWKWFTTMHSGYQCLLVHNAKREFYKIISQSLKLVTHEKWRANVNFMQIKFKLTDANFCKLCNFNAFKYNQWPFIINCLTFIFLDILWKTKLFIIVILIIICLEKITIIYILRTIKLVFVLKLVYAYLFIKLIKFT